MERSLITKTEPRSDGSVVALEMQLSENSSKTSSKISSTLPDLICLSHLRWDFVYQRPQHLLSRCAKGRRTFFIEEPIFESGESWWLEISQRECGVWVAVPHMPHGLSRESLIAIQHDFIDQLITEYQIELPILWYYTPMALSFTYHVKSSAIIYDCMDELSAFKGAPKELRNYEEILFEQAHVVFTGGRSLFEAKQHQHPNIHPFPSSVDVAHFAQAKNITNEAADQATIPHPRIGFYGVIDERMNLALLDEIAQAKPDWQLIMIGPVVKIDSATLPQHANIHYLGSKRYEELPNYLAGWDVAMLPFALNESTRFISPTKTPEYLAAGKPVVSTSIRDVVYPYGQQGLVHIADKAEEFVSAIEAALQQTQLNPEWVNKVEAFLTNLSWDKTWAKMMDLVEAAIAQNNQSLTSQRSPVPTKLNQHSSLQRSA